MKAADRIKLIAAGQILGVLAVAVAIFLVAIGNNLKAQNDYAHTTENPLTDSGTKTNTAEEPTTSLTEIPDGYRDWKLIAVSRIVSPKGSQIRAELGNEIAIKAYRQGEIRFPDGAMIVALHWTEVSPEENNKVLAQGFPGANLQSFTPGSAVNMQFMVKDSKKYSATGGWGFGDFANGKPGNAKLMKTCFACHRPAEDHDFVFTRYAPPF